MKCYKLLLFLLLPAITSCRRTIVVTCTAPQIVLQQQGYTPSEWDTIITRVYDTGYQLPMVADTFVANNVTNELLISPDMAKPKDFLIFLPSVNRTYRLYDIKITPRTVTITKGEQTTCYDDISFTLDSTVVSGLSVATGKVYAQLKK